MDSIAAALQNLRGALLAGPVAAKAYQNQLTLAQTQWLPREKLEQSQLAGLRELAGFSVREVPFWRDRIDLNALASAATLAEAMNALPVLSRYDLREHYDALRARHLPRGHAYAQDASSSGSTGAVVRVAQTNVFLQWQHVLGLRAYLWAGFDFKRVLAFINRRPAAEAPFPNGALRPRWAAPGLVPFASGRSHLLNVATTSLEQQCDWLRRVRPDYLFTYPSIARGLARLARDADAPLDIDTVLTIGSIVDEEVRATVRAGLGARIYDVYSCQEAGVLALQCPDARGYHRASEAAIVEVVDDAGLPCEPGQIGRVLVTPLFNFAMPLFRYEVGDYAVAGAACACGRGLPALERIMGRRRNILVTADGRHFWPDLEAFCSQNVVRVRQHQFRQVAWNGIEIWLQVEEKVTPSQEAQLRTIAAAALRVPMDISFHYVSRFPTAEKHEDFVSLLGEAAS